MDERLETNRRHWDEVVPIHAASRFYDVDAFLGGRCTLLPIEVAGVGDPNARSLLHLQCHFGLDTLSWARRGAQVTGVDFSSAAVAKARELAARANIEARFVETEVTETARALDGERFDIVFTSWGVLGWLPDLDAWAATVAATLKPGGLFYIAELHPTILLFDGSAELSRTYPYFRTEEQLIEETDGTYAERGASVENRRRYEWIYELGQVVNALIDAGLRIERLEEHEGTCCAIVPSLVEGDDGLFRLPASELSIPTSFSIRATTN